MPAAAHQQPTPHDVLLGTSSQFPQQLQALRRQAQYPMDWRLHHSKKVRLRRLPLCLVRIWHGWVNLRCLMAQLQGMRRERRMLRKELASMIQQMQQAQQGQLLWQIQRQVLLRQREQLQLALLQLRQEQEKVQEQLLVLVRA